MSDYLALPPAPRLRLVGEDALFPVRRIFCIGRNYADHAKEMGEKAEALFFMKPAEAATQATRLDFPKATENLHHEVEMVVALGAGGQPIASGVGIDLTRRDQQARMKEKRAPWEIAKSFEASAPMGILKPGKPPAAGAISLAVNGEPRQAGDLSDMLLDLGAILEGLRVYFEPGPGDVIFTGTPAGVSPVRPGDHVRARISGLPDLDLHFNPEQ